MPNMPNKITKSLLSGTQNIEIAHCTTLKAGVKLIRFPVPSRHRRVEIGRIEDLFFDYGGTIFREDIFDFNFGGDAVELYTTKKITF